ncbi:thiamine pyrophosphate-binding protein [Kitasatospora sp. NPDC004669]|uniref:thiamine pyrophosphate-binding protein n=1 Tax=Kitasatospora sp. NPDC004669 TaxID=3154555 RepID=UPI0033A3CFE5
MSASAPAAPGVDLATELARLLTAEGFGPFFGTPCGILEPFYAALERDCGLLTVPREDAAVGVAAGAAAAGRLPAVLMQNSGLGQSVNALASLTVPYRVPMLLIVSLRGVDPDPTPENLVMGRLTEPLLDDLGVPAVRIDADHPADQVRWAHRLVAGEGRPAALLVTPSLFGWRA